MSEGKKPKISLICAVAEKNRAIGKDNALLWNIPADLKHFKAVTSGHSVVMGQRTFESIGRALPNRDNIVITSDPKFRQLGVEICYSIPEALAEARKGEKEEVFIIGGGSIYAQTIDLADRLYLTLVEGDFEADTFFPDYRAFREVESSEIIEDNGYRFRYVILEKR